MRNVVRDLFLEAGRISLGALVIVGVLLSTREYFLSNAPGTKQVPANPQVEIGKALLIDGKSITAPVMSVVLFTSVSCRYSVDNYSRHAEIRSYALQHGNISFRRVETSTKRSVVRSLTLSPLTLFRQIKMRMTPSVVLSRLNLTPRVTPAIVVLDHNGIIRRIFNGTLRSRTQQPILDKLLSAASSAVSGDSFWKENQQSKIVLDRDLDNQAPFVVLDVRERDAFALVQNRNVVNIPREELEVRVPIEIGADHEVVLDCSYNNYSECDHSAQLLRLKGFSTTIEGRGSIASSCSYSPVE